MESYKQTFCNRKTRIYLPATWQQDRQVSKKEGVSMREEKMKEWMQQDSVIPDKVHDGFEKGLQQIFQIDQGSGSTESMGAGKEETRQEKCRGFLHKAGMAAAVAAAVAVIVFHAQIYSFAKAMFFHETVKVGETDVQEANMKRTKINDGVLTDGSEADYFESLEDLGKRLGVSFLKSSEENDVTGKGRVTAYMDDSGEIRVSDNLFVVNDVSDIHYTEDGQSGCHLDSDNSYTIQCDATFYTDIEDIQDGSEVLYDGAEEVEDYDTKNGFHATIFYPSRESGTLAALFYYNNIKYEYFVSSVNDNACSLEEFKGFLDTLFRPDLIDGTN